MAAIDVGPGDEVIVPAMTFVSTATMVVQCGATPVFADVDPASLLLTAAEVERRLSPRTKAVISVDYAGQPCDYDALRSVADRHNLRLIADACHSFGGSWNHRSVGTLADMTVLSFHPVKHITTGEGGMILTDDAVLGDRMRRFRNHGIDVDASRRMDLQTWEYDVVEAGLNYRLTDFQCALGLAQLRRLPIWLARRREIAARYGEALKALPVETLVTAQGASHAYHLYVIQVDGDARAAVFALLRESGIGVNVHYIPVHLHSLYRDRFGTTQGQCPVAENAYKRILSLPMFAAMTDAQVDRVVSALANALSAVATRL
jgi:perosamine synthetase